MRIRAKCVSVTTAVSWSFNALIGKIGPLLLASIGYGTYVFFGSWCFTMAVFMYYCVPETKGESLEEIDMMFTRVEESPCYGNECLFFLPTPSAEAGGFFKKFWHYNMSTAI
ncbi:hypothetical protein BC937DRAFT_91926 [Endogone sp. FLAS-F59071]|nr:hypothetical protein BC937DRAFT_91926 [Endogone sp. FLAS-F59071]|eukprot:RUS15837.1 hypothetical protein BC937DRAFT_91926 [Endogone sp. FLAS-F59071]